MALVDPSMDQENIAPEKLSKPSSSVPSSSQPPSSSAPTTGATPHNFRIPWGKHKGRALSEVPKEYITWLTRSSDGYKANKPMQEAVEAYLSTPTSVASITLSQPTSQALASSQAQQEPAGPYRLQFDKHAGKCLEEIPADYVFWLKKGESYNTDAALRAAVEEWEKTPRVYRLCFGKHKGLTLAEVPPSYITWLEENDALEGHEDLRKALREHKSKQAAEQRSLVKAPSKKKDFELPPESPGDYRRYYYGGVRSGGQMWVGCNDCVRYFGAEPNAMRATGVPSHYRGQRFWLHQVFAFAKHFGTSKGETPTKALNKFKAKNYNNPGAGRRR